MYIGNNPSNVYPMYKNDDKSSSGKKLPAAEMPKQETQDTSVVQLNTVASGVSPVPPPVNNTGLPDGLKAGVEQLSGYSLNDVQVHYNSSKPAQLQAHAYAQGSDIHIAPGQEKHLPHEAWHVVQQKQGRVKATKQLKGKIPLNDDAGLEHEADVMGAWAMQQKTKSGTGKVAQFRPVYTAAAPVQRSYVALSSMGKARVDQEAEHKYQQKALDYEMGMIPAIVGDNTVQMSVAVLLAKVKAIVDAWARHTSVSTADTYEREFGWPPGDGYYGAFDMTARNIAATFTDPGKPMRTKLKLVYNAVRNNNMSKWLKLAAIELQRAAAGKAAKTWKIRTESRKVENGGLVVSKHNLDLTSGFAADSGLSGSLTGPLLAEMAATAAAEKRQHNPMIGWKRDDFSHDHMSNAMAWKPSMVKANQERSFLADGAGIAAEDKNDLRRGDIPDITDEEIDQVHKRRGLAPGASHRAAFRADATSKTHWGQGRDVYDVNLTSDSARAAQSVNARLEAGISGSTDLMMHAFTNLGLAGNTLKSLRLALAGWMMANRDHSFYEVLKAAEPYGLPFNPAPGQIYEDAENLFPLTRDAFAGVLPNDAGMVNVYPGNYLSDAYKDQLALALPNPAHTQQDVNTGLHGLGMTAIHTQNFSERESAAAARLNELVAATVFNAADTGSIKNKTLRSIRKSAPYMALGTIYGEERTELMLDAMLRQHHAGAGMGDQTPKTKLALAGVPLVILDFVTPPVILQIEALRAAVAAAPVAAGVLDRTQILIAEAALALPASQKSLVLNGLIKKYHGEAHLNTDPEKEAAGRMERMSQLELIAGMEKTSGTWYSWGNNAQLNAYVAAGSIRDATSAVPSAQGPGLYVATKISSSYTYGNAPGQGLLIIIMKNVPTINRKNAAQMAKLKALVGPGVVGDILETSGAYKNHIIEMLLFYGANFGRLTTNKGVTLTRDIRRAPQAAMRTEFGKLDAGAKANFRTQAQLFGVDASAW